MRNSESVRKAVLSDILKMSSKFRYVLFFIDLFNFLVAFLRPFVLVHQSTFWEVKTVKPCFMGVLEHRVAAMESFYGTSKRITALAPFGPKFLSGLLRRPVFVAGDATIKAVAVNAWQWAEENKEKKIQLHSISYRNFKRGEFKVKDAEHMLDKAIREKAGSLPAWKESAG